MKAIAIEPAAALELALADDSLSPAVALELAPGKTSASLVAQPTKPNKAAADIPCKTDRRDTAENRDCDTFNSILTKSTVLANRTTL